MIWLLPPLTPHFDAALRDVHASAMEARMAAARRLSQPDAGKEDDAREALRTLTRDKDARVRATAVEGLTEIGTAADHRLLLECLDDKDGLVREVALVALSMIDHPDKDALLIGALDSPHPEVRFQALSCCAEQCPQTAAPHFLRLTRDDDASVRSNAARILSRSVTQPQSAPVLARLRELLEDPDGSVSYEAALALGADADDAAIAILVRAIDDPERRLDALDALGVHDTVLVRSAAATILESFLKPLVVKAAAARVLARIGDPRGAEGLHAVLTALRGDGRSYAVEIIGELRLKELAPALAQLAARPRGVELETLLNALERLAPNSEAARGGLAILARGGGEIARRADEALTSSQPSTAI